MPDPARARDEERIEAILEQWFSLRHAGRDPDLGDLCASAPELQPRVERVLERHAALLETDGNGASRNGLPVERLGDYRLRSRIGRGGMGEVFLALQESLRRLVALKVLRPELAADPMRRLRFHREAEITAALDHPNIVPVYEVGERGGHLYIAMKLLNGVTLDQAPRPWNPVELAAIGAQVARALHAAHEVGVVHRDVKPANIFLAERPYVLDFGLARGPVDQTLTSEGHAPGTLSFMAPEQLLGGPGALSASVDVYSLGATLYACLVGRPPFDEPRGEVLMRRILAQEPRAIGGPLGQRDLETIIMRALDKEPSRRFATALEMAHDLERFAKGLPIRSRRTGIATRTYRLVRRHRGASAATAVALLLTATLALLLWHNMGLANADQRWQSDKAWSEFRDGHFADARATIGEVRQRFGSTSELDDLASRVSTTLKREALLDQLQADRRYLDLVHLAEMAHQLSGGHPEVLAEPLTELALLLLASYAHDAASVRAGLGEIESSFPRCHAILSAKVAGQDVLAALAAVDSAGPEAWRADDCVFASCLLRVADMPLDAIEGELKRAGDVDPDHERYRFGRALVCLLRGDQDLADALLRGLVRPATPRPEVHIELARQAIRRRQPAKARRQLALAETALAKNGRPPPLRLDLARLEVLMLENAHAEFEARATAAAQRWPESAMVPVLQGYHAELVNDPDRARACFEAARQKAVLPWNERRIDSFLLALDVRRAQWEAEANGGIDRGEIDPLIARSEALRRTCSQANDPALEDEVLVGLFHLRTLLGDNDGAWQALRAALDVADDSEQANHAFVLTEYQRLWNGEDDDPAHDPDLAELGREAMQRARRYVARARADATYCQPSRLAEVLAATTALAFLYDDRELMRWAGPQAHALIDSLEQPGLVTALQFCQQQLGIADWGEVR